MSGPEKWGRKSLNKKEAVLYHYWRPDVTKKMWVARGKLAADDGDIDVEIYPEHRSKIEKAEYNITWDVAGAITGDAVPVRLAENHNGRRRVAAVLKCGTDEWMD